MIAQKARGREEIGTVSLTERGVRPVLARIIHRNC